MQVITCTVRRQELNVSTPTIAALSENYINVKASFSSEWEGLVKWFHIHRVDDNTVGGDYQFVDNEVADTVGINLNAGEWEIWIHGSITEGGETVKRITTNVKTITVVPSGTNGGIMPVLPTSVVEDIYEEIDGLEDQIATKQDALTLPLPISQGGTGANNATDAKTNLGIVEQQIEIDDTLTQQGEAADAKATGDAIALKQDALSLPLSIANGGTGSNSASSARTALGLGSAAVANIDTTLAVTGDAADSKTVGDAISDIQGDIGDIETALNGKQDSLQIPLPVSMGGTGANNAADARTNLGISGGGGGGEIYIDPTLTIAGDAADAKATGDAIALKQDALTLPLGIAQGGTGSNSASSARTALGLGSASVADIDATLAIVGDAADAKAVGDAIALKQDALTLPLSIAQGGTGSNSASSARTALGLGTAAVSDIDNTLGVVGDAADSKAVGDALALKANTSDVNTALALKANASDVTTALAGKQDTLGTGDITTAMLQDGNVTRAKLASDALYSPVKIGNSPYSIVADDIGKTIHIGTSGGTVTLTSAVSEALPVGAEIGIICSLLDSDSYLTLTLPASSGRTYGAGAAFTSAKLIGGETIYALKKMWSGGWFVFGMNVEVVS